MNPNAPADVATAAVLDILADDTDGTLPSLTREELWTLSDQPVLAHSGDASWWAERDAAERDLVMQTAQRGLVVRNLLTAATDGDGLVVDPRLSVILRARSRPSWLLVLGEPQNTDVQLVVHGIDLDEHLTAAALVSARLEGIYLNRLIGVDELPDVVADWLLRRPEAVGADTAAAGEAAGDGDGKIGRTVELIRPHPEGTDQPVRSERAIVLGADDSWVLAQLDPTSEQPGEPEPVDAAALRAWLADRLPNRQS